MGAAERTRFDGLRTPLLGQKAAALAKTTVVEAETSAGEEARKGITAFFERRKPRWQSA